MATTLSHTKTPTLPTRDMGSILINCGAVVATAIVGAGLWIMMS
ncbi:hypothetical protein [Lichenicola cladoniae]|nr:hypothetical protein [Lichenicola cladoniae]